MRVLVIGGRGFIGKVLVSHLNKKKIKIDVLSRYENVQLTRDESFVNFVKGDLIDPAFDFVKLVSEYDIIFNCAGELLNESLMYSIHVGATEHLIAACKKVTQGQKHSIHWVQLSSVGAYGPSRPKACTERVVTEDTITAPVGMYEVTKTLADEIIMKAADEFFSYSILRPANVFGASMPNNSIRKLGGVIKNGWFFYIGKLGAVSNYVHVNDVAEALYLCGFDLRAKNEIFNLSNDCMQEVTIRAMACVMSVGAPTIRVNEYLVRCFVFFFSRVHFFPLQKSRVDALVNRSYYPNRKINHVLDFFPSRCVAETISEALLEHEVNGDGRSK